MSHDSHETADRCADPEGDSDIGSGTRPDVPRGPMVGAYPLAKLLRRVRRTADLSQRELARHTGVAAGTVARYETGALTPSLDVLQRMLSAAGYLLVVVDGAGRVVPPLEVWPGVADLAGRRLPPHLDTILDPQYGDWWADVYGLTAPPETFRRNRAYRDYLRLKSRWDVRVGQLRNAPEPQPPLDPDTAPRSSTRLVG